MLPKKYKDILVRTDDLLLVKVNSLNRFYQQRSLALAECRGFINVSVDYEKEVTQAGVEPLDFLKRYQSAAYPSDFTQHYKIRHKEKVVALFSKIDASAMTQQFDWLAALPERYVHSPSGQSAQLWLQTLLQQWVADSGRQDVEVQTVETINHAGQASVILKIGQLADDAEAIVLGTHLDTLKGKDKAFGENATGIVTLLATAKILLQEHFAKTVYLVWYAGSESGKLGAQSIIEDLQNKKIKIAAVLHLKHTGYKRKDELGLGLIDDATDAALTTFVADLVTVYLKLPLSAMRCGYACSDHMLWYQHQYRVAFPYPTMREDAINMGAQDVSYEQMLNFTKLGIAFAVELGC